MFEKSKEIEAWLNNYGLKDYSVEVEFQERTFTLQVIFRSEVICQMTAEEYKSKFDFFETCLVMQNAVIQLIIEQQMHVESLSGAISFLDKEISEKYGKEFGIRHELNVEQKTIMVILQDNKKDIYRAPITFENKDAENIRKMFYSIEEFIHSYRR